MNVKELTNNQLVNLCAQEPRNRSAWFEFYARFDERIWLVIYRECNQKGLSENTVQFNQILQDLVQDVYVKLVEKNCKALKAFIGVSENSFFTYIGIIARNVVRNYLKKMGAQKRPSIEKSIDEILPIDIFKSTYVDPEDEFTLVIRKEEIEDVIDEFLKGRDKARNKLIFKLYFYEGFSPEEIASQFNFSLSAKRIGNIISEIKQVLRNELLAQKMEVY